MKNSQTRLHRGHFTLKSSVLAPTAMSYMGQDFISNHMKSHYRRILSAKAAVDTSPPKSMKMHTKVRDQKKRAALTKRTDTPMSLRTMSPSVEDLSSSQNGLSPLNSERSAQSTRSLRPFTDTPLQQSQFEQCIGMQYSTVVPTSSPRNRASAQRQNWQTKKSSQLFSQTPVSPIPRELNNSIKTGRHLRSKKDLKGIIKESLEAYEETSSSDIKDNVSTLMSGLQESDDVRSPGYSDMKEKHTENSDLFDLTSRSLVDTGSRLRGQKVPHLDLSQVSYSHRAPPSIRTEQKYLRFISDVTTDILARGIFSNRVLQKVFDLHIERQKDHLDENRLKEMIEQLKEDLNITDS
ncbi:Spermatogenesis-associated protein 7 [Acropora cervicornis]|uniref:Spermatogenesis-associated protein 7 n=1 Tax=Acropora cervicornis TaxID=6130 RepID=A0AAD9V5K2_ACRCE|nr:Spermatogenesis-associated protein 7 [Acropora cervicornis]